MFGEAETLHQTYVPILLLNRFIQDIKLQFSYKGFDAQGINSCIDTDIIEHLIDNRDYSLPRLG